ncbi:endonuclease/exonuclease/phosphatase family protein [Neorhodopirellula pilleata]|uniref:Endonuclease/exonuclease/phosphatase domain-containing protein n=1 Tax=Neorhodopirellula pilleata TaxID=2714738 RepID=A0A5C6A6S5_9BACT|nr:endonuclease/exonuclease/phosphatase family protein [Neorhodopirellula pilleata]TWT95085.1 hypothetical protein Pla100_36660 [Neorhodopirellula pilleata]
MLAIFNYAIYVLFAVLVTGSLLPISSHPHWFIRGWDYPRVQILVLTWIAAGVFMATNVTAGLSARWGFYCIVGLSIILTLWHLIRIIPYTPLTSPQVKSWDSANSVSEINSMSETKSVSETKSPTSAEDPEPSAEDSKRLRVMISNVQEENDQFDTWRDVVLDVGADVVIVAEVDDRWAKVIDGLKDVYPEQVVQPQDNWYGIALISRYPVVEAEIRFLVQEDIPSIDALVELPNGDQVRIIGVHPRPPEPIRDNDATARDAELVLWGKELADDDRPIVIGGDLNDVAWSQSTRLFLRLSGLLDPRRGRGFFNSFHADRFWMRFPLDHVFHSTHFALRELRRLPHVGSDHFPIYIDLQLERVMKDLHEPLEQQVDDQEEAEERLDRAEEELGLEAETVDEVDGHPATP